MTKKKPVVIKLNPEKEIGYKITDVGSGKVIKEGSTKVKDLDKKRMGGMSKVKKYRSGKMVTEDGYEQLLPPGEDPGEGYKGSPDMYPDYEEDRKEAEKFKNKDRNRNSSGKTKSMAYGGSVMVKTKLGRNKPTKIC
jgi:hypothetical protein